MKKKKTVQKTRPSVKPRARAQKTDNRAVYAHELPSFAPTEIVHRAPDARHWHERHRKAREKHWADLKARTERRFVDLGRGETLYQKFKKK